MSNHDRELLNDTILDTDIEQREEVQWDTIKATVQDFKRLGFSNRLFIDELWAARLHLEPNLLRVPLSDQKIACDGLSVCEKLSSVVGDMLYIMPVVAGDAERVWSLHCKVPSFHFVVDDEETLEYYQSFSSKKLVEALQISESDPICPSFVGAHRRLNLWFRLFIREMTSDIEGSTLIDLFGAVQDSRRLRIAGVLLYLEKLPSEPSRVHEYIENVKATLQMLRGDGFALPTIAIYSYSPYRESFLSQLRKLLDAQNVVVIHHPTSGVNEDTA